MELALATIVVPNYDKAINYFVNTLGFNLCEDKDLGEGKRWVVVSPASQNSSGILLARAANHEQKKAIGNQAADRVAFFLYTNDFETTYDRFLTNGVDFQESPRTEKYGKVAVFKDIFGNRWDLLQPF